MSTKRITNLNLNLVLAAAAGAIAIGAAQPAYAFDFCTTGGNFPYLCRGAQSWGTTAASGGYRVKTGLAVYKNYADDAAANHLVPPPLPRDYAWAGGAFTGEATIFGVHEDLVDVEVSARNQYGAASARMLTRVLGTSLLDRTYTTITITLPVFGYGEEFSEGFDWGVVSAEVDAQAFAGVLLTLQARGGSGGGAASITLTGTPELTAHLLLSADVSYGCEASASSSLTLISVRTPVEGSLTLTSDLRHINYTIDGSFALDTIDGEASASFDCGIGSYEWALGHFTAFSYQHDLFNFGGTINL